ncbi:hypothetical protein TrRE_jg9019 [Triparma retinervis]|jgi:hypothetical protein|uniref:tRNA/rRNA methyltransferase SpoU type domain-containing protein n=1 Tax=Triparma retinervis TaxID=2557542 RepID=A0A9W7A1G7_9STRA|nr:hypothetical protein TrRE_jg9019 [Triparma retinervis]
MKTCLLYSIPVVVIGAPKLFEAVYAHLPESVRSRTHFKGSNVGNFAASEFFIYCPNASPPGESGEEYREKNVVRLQNVGEVLAMLNGSDPVKILGIEIPSSTTQRITALDEHPPVTMSTALMLGNEGAGMSPKQVSVCDEFVYVKQYSGDTASFNVAVAFGIVADRLSGMLEF